MTKREILTQLVSAYIQGSGGKFPKLTEDGRLSDPWYKTVDAICAVENDEQLKLKAKEDPIYNGKYYYL